MTRFNRDPRIITAKFASVCPETGRAINKGDKCAYYPNTRQAFHIDSKSADNVRALEFSNAFNMPDANW